MLYETKCMSLVFIAVVDLIWYDTLSLGNL